MKKEILYKNKYIKYKKKYRDLKKYLNTIKIEHPVKINIDTLKTRFPHKKGVDFTKLLMTSASIYSMSTNASSKLLVDIIRKYFDDDNITVTDGTANVGSDTLMLAMNFKKVNAIEISNIACKHLVHNINVYKQTNIKTFCGSVIDIIKKTEQDVVYIDPPWGGPTYKYYSQLKLFLDDIEISRFYELNKSRAKLFIFRVPRNYNFTYFFKTVNSAKYEIYSYMENKIIKYYYLIIQS